VEDIVGMVANGEEEESLFLEDEPDLTVDHIDSCLIYADEHRYYDL
jgi:uncharacterized protein (DUF433 family)